MSDAAILLSIRPRFAEMILSGVKTVELRRVRPRVSPGDRVIMYVTAPQKQIRALLLVEEIIECSPGELWLEADASAGVTPHEFWNYFEGAVSAVGIRIRVIEDLNEPMSLNQLRNVEPGFRPPQSYRYVERLKADLRSALSSLWCSSLSGAAAS